MPGLFVDSNLTSDSGQNQKHEDTWMSKLSDEMFVLYKSACTYKTKVWYYVLEMFSVIINCVPLLTIRIISIMEG